MNREELIAYDKWLTRRKLGTGEIISPERAADIYLAEHSLHPAEGAEKPNAMKFLSDNGYGSGFNYTTKQVANLMQEFAAQPQPTAEGAEAFLDEMELGEPLQTGEFYYRSEVLEAMNKFATLHAQRIAEKMVEERLREELIRYIKWYGGFNYENMTDEMLVNEYLKTRDSHESV